MNITHKTLILVLLLFTCVAFAQGNPPPPNPPAGLPIDSLLWLGGIAALAYGAIKKYNNPKK